MIKTIIVDDEYNAREFLEKLLTRYFPAKFLILDKCENVDDAIIAIEKYNPELVFLDIQMPNKNGFELFKELNKIKFVNNVDGTMFPLRQIPKEQKELKNFKWLDARRPKNKLELFE